MNTDTYKDQVLALYDAKKEIAEAFQLFVYSVLIYFILWTGPMIAVILTGGIYAEFMRNNSLAMNTLFIARLSLVLLCIANIGYILRCKHYSLLSLPTSIATQNRCSCDKKHTYLFFAYFDDRSTSNHLEIRCQKCDGMIVHYHLPTAKHRSVVQNT